MSGTKTGRAKKKYYQRIAAAPRITPLVPGKESDYVFEDDPKEKEAMILERHRRNGLAKLQKIDARFAESEREYRLARVAILEALRDADLARIRELEGEPK